MAINNCLHLFLYMLIYLNSFMWLGRVLEFSLFEYVIVSTIWSEQYQCLINKDI